MKKLTAEGRFESGIDELLKGKAYAFTATVDNDGIGLGVAVANEPGYYPIPRTWAHGGTYDEMAAHADELNEAMGVTDYAAAMIVCSSMKAGRVA